MMKIAILDRDGTLNALGDEYIASPDDWHPLPGALEAVARLSRAGWHVVLATNQPGLGRGVVDVHVLNAIHAKMLRLVAAAGGRIDAVFFCPHTESEVCNCRKPASGLMEQIRDRFGAEGPEIVVVGNCLAHLQAGSAIGARLHLVCTGHSAHLDTDAELTEAWPPGTRSHVDLSAFADALLQAEAAPKPAPH